MSSIKRLDQSHNDEMLHILESSPMETDVLDLHFDKSPDIFSTTRLWSDNYKYYGVFVSEKLAGFGMYLIYKGYVGDKLHNIVYGGNFCIDKKQRKKGLIIKLSEFILNEMKKDGDFGFCLILQGNRLAERYFDEGNIALPSLPSKKIILAYEARSILILQPKKLNSEYVIKTAKPKDITLIKEFVQKVHKPGFLSPLINQESFQERLNSRPNLNIKDYYLAFEGKDLVGMCVAWDMSAVKRTRILKYKKGFKLVRLLYALISKILHYPDLPEKGDAIKEIYLTDVIIKDQNYLTLEALLKSIYNDYRKKKYNLINFGSYSNDPLLKATKSFFSRPLRSNIYFSSNDSKKLIDNKIDFSKPFVDMALI